jgi:sulfatase modifying factor 1
MGSILFLSISCSSPKHQDGRESSSETVPSNTDSTAFDSSVPETDSQDSAPTDSTIDTSDTDLIDHSNETPLTPTADCIHPEVTVDCTDDWCRIPKGCFIFGSVDAEGNVCRSKYGEDQAQVTLTHDFEIGQTETTQAQWKAAGFELPSPALKAPCDDCPITWITIYEAMTYANALSVKAGLPECYDLSNCIGTVGTGCPEGKLNAWGCSADDAYVCSGNVHKYLDPYTCPGYRLPTTAEWEYAARAGTRTATYIGDMETDITEECISHPSLDSIAWHCGNTENAQEEPQYIAVRQKAPNGFGLYDMLGNVGEYCASTRSNESLNVLVGQDGSLVDPHPSLEEYSDDMEVVLRGSFYMYYPCYTRSSYGSPGVGANHRVAYQGFRLVRTLDVESSKIKKAAIKLGESGFANAKCDCSGFFLLNITKI